MRRNPRAAPTGGGDERWDLEATFEDLSVTDKFTDWAAATMSGERLEVNVTFDSARGYIASAPELRQPVVALSLANLRKRIETLLLPDNVVLQLDGLAERERHRRRAQAQLAR
jgi:hypothetical protein